MGDDPYHHPRARARVAELMSQPKAELIDLALPQLGTRISRSKLARWRKQELAWAIAVAEFAREASPE